MPTFEGAYGRSYQQEHDPELWGFLSDAVGVNPDLKVWLIHGTTDGPVPYEKSADFAVMLTNAGYDVQLASWDGGHSVPSELTVETIKEVLGR